MAAAGAFSVVAGLAAPLTAQAAPAAVEDQSQEYVVLYTEGASTSSGRAAVEAAGGTVVEENAAVGVATVASANPSFRSEVAGKAGVAGVARNVAIGQADPATGRAKREDVERLTAEERAAAAGSQAQAQVAPPSVEPLGGLQWDMRMIRATAEGSYQAQPGDRRVLVGIMDTGIDGSHPDIAPNFNRDLSRNFTRDIPSVDGPCAEEPDRSCTDPPDVDEDGHGTHVAGTVASPLNGLGIAGVAPNVTLVNVRAGQDSGYFFLQPTVNALTYAGDVGIDVVNMSFFIDPWLFNCRSNPADSPEEQREQRTIIDATQRALAYARDRGVTLVAALGNEQTNLAFPSVDTTSPDFPPDQAKERRVDNSCLVMPAEGRNVIGVSALGPSTQKADYSNYGLERTDVSAPGGYYRDYFGTPQYRTVDNLILAPYPQALAVANGEVDENGTPTTPFVVRNCSNGVCAYYQYLQGTSMATPHAVGVAALIVSEFGALDPLHAGGVTLAPATVEQRLFTTATDRACPTSGYVDYPDRPAEYDAYCYGTPERNGFYGNGIVDALRAVQR